MKPWSTINKPQACNRPPLTAPPPQPAACTRSADATSDGKPPMQSLLGLLPGASPEEAALRGSNRQTHVVTSDGVKLVYQRHGRVGGPVVVLVSGAGRPCRLVAERMRHAAWLAGWHALVSARPRVIAAPLSTPCARPALPPRRRCTAGAAAGTTST